MLAMNPQEIGEAYDQITHLWEDGFNTMDGIEAHEKALRFCDRKGAALDVGCGPTGRFIDLLCEEGFEPEGVDVSSQMLARAAERHPGIEFHQQDICAWELPKQYSFITAWDSIWHIPLAQQAPVLRKLVEGLMPKGVLIFSFGATEDAGEHRDSNMGPEVYYSSLGVNGFLELLLSMDVFFRHLEYDQHPELHAYLIVQKKG